MNLIPGNVYVTLPQKDDFLYNAQIITDFIKPTINNHKNYILKYTNGKNTLWVLKDLLARQNFDFIVIFVENYESFYFDFAEFKDFNFIYLEKEKITMTNYIKYEKLTLKLLKQYNTNVSKNKLCKLSKKLCVPDIISSIHASLTRPEMYLYDKDATPSKIYNFLKQGPKSLIELKNEIKNRDLMSHIKSLVFCKIIEKKNEKFCLNLKIK